MPDSRAAKPSVRVLVVDDEVNLRFAIEKGLRAAGHLAESVGSGKQAIEKLRDEPFDVVMTDLKMPAGDGRAVIQWLGSHSPTTRIIVVSAFVTADFRQQYDPATGLRILEKPVELDTLVSVVEEIGPRRGFYGTALEVELFDYVQMVALSGRDKLVELRTPTGNGIIWFEHGDIVHCEYGAHKGEAAFYKLLAVGRGVFKEVFFRDPPTRTIMQSSTHLLMEAARQMDEGTLGQDEGDAVPVATTDEASFAGLAEEVEAEAGGSPGLPVSDDDELILPADDDVAPSESRPEAAAAMPTPETSSQAMSLLDDPETRALMLGQFFEFDGVNGVAIVSSTGKVLAEDMRGNTALVTLAGFYMRGAARIARALGYNVFDGVLARAATGQQLLIVGMGATSAVLSVEIGSDAEQIRDEILGVDA